MNQSYQIVRHRKPPSTRISAPVTKLLARELARKIAAPINSCGSPNRSIGVGPMIVWGLAVGVAAGFKSTRRFCSAGKKTGVMGLTRTPLGAHSRARHLLRLSTGGFAAE